MSRAEALHVLGLEEGASKEDIRSAHRRLMLQIHPDKGGTSYLAAKINEAKDVLLKG
jgi:curved DNA-binding protein CbpA